MSKAALAAAASLTVLVASVATVGSGRLVRWIETTVAGITTTTLSSTKAARIAATPTPTVTPTPAGSSGTVNGNPAMSLGVNVVSPEYYVGSRSFMNLTAGSRWTLVSAANQWGDMPADRLNDNKEVVRLAANEQVARVLGEPTAAYRGKSVEILCRWQGKGEAWMFGVPVKNSRSLSSNSLQFTWVPASGTNAFFRYNNIDPSNPLRNIDCREKDADPDALFDPTFLAEVKRYKTVRFLKWMPSAEANSPVTWSTRTKAGDGVIFGYDSIAVEYMVALANETKTNPWFTLSWNADADYVRQFATYVRDHLDPSLVAYVENSNEVWNWQYPVTFQAREEARAANLRPDDDNIGIWYRYGQKSGEVMDIWANVYGTANKSRLVRVVAMQSAYVESSKYLFEWNNIASKFDALAIAPYFGEVLQAGLLKTQAAADAYLLSTGKAQVDYTISNAKGHKANAAKYGLRLVTYEAGQHYVSPDEDLQLSFVQRSPKMGDLYSYYLTQWREQVGDLMVLFADYGGVGRYGAWGMQEYTGQPLSEAPKANAVELFSQSYLR